VGSANGTGAAASFSFPQGIATDSVGNVYVADTNNDTIRKITPAGVVTTLAGTPGVGNNLDGIGAAASFEVPWGIAVDSAGNVFVADTSSNIRKITPAGVVTTLAGPPQQSDIGYADGIGASALFYFPRSLATDSAGNVYVADTGNQAIRQITPAGVVTTLAGNAPFDGSANGIGSAASFNNPYGVATDGAGNVYVSDSFNNAIRKITPAGLTTTIAGTSEVIGSADATGSEASFNFQSYEQWRGPSWSYINGIVSDSVGNIYVADTNNDTIRKITPAGTVSTFAGIVGVSGHGDGIGTNALFNSPTGLAIDSADNLYVADSGNNTIRMITPVGQVSTLAGVAGNGGSYDGPGVVATFSNPQGLAADAAGNVYVADSNNYTIRKITPSGMVSTFAGTAREGGNSDGTGAAARFYTPNGLVTDSAGNVYVVDSYNMSIRKITPAGVVTTLALAGSPTYLDGYMTASFSYPSGIAIDTAGNLFVADTLDHRIAKITTAGVVTTLVGTPGGVGFVAGAHGKLAYPSGLALYGSKLYVTTEEGVAVVINVQ
jgi:sugar lactone lactonase YvrE